MLLATVLEESNSEDYRHSESDLTLSGSLDDSLLGSGIESRALDWIACSLTKDCGIKFFIMGIIRGRFIRNSVRVGIKK